MYKYTFLMMRLKFQIQKCKRCHDLLIPVSLQTCMMSVELKRRYFEKSHSKVPTDFACMEKTAHRNERKN